MNVSSRVATVRRPERSHPVGGWVGVTPVGTLIRRPPITCEPSTTVADVARLMAAERVSSALVTGGDGLGIVTDRDLRTRVLAVGRTADTPVAEVMTSPVTTIPETTSAEEALLLMLEHGFHHAPVVDAGGRIVGMVTDTDLLALERASPFALKSEIERAPDREEVVRLGRTLPNCVATLVDARMDPVSIGRVVGVAVDSLTRRLLDLGIDELGTPPVAWAWLAFGSQARHEQALRTDQDHGLALEAGPSGVDPDIDRYFGLLGRSVTDGLEAAGIARCAGRVMAENPALRKSVGGWKGSFAAWMDAPERYGSVLTSITFDYRRVAGPLDVEPELDEVVATARRHTVFVRHLAFRALDQRPPTGFLGHLVVEAKGEHAGRLDIKHRGITLVSNLARLFAVRAASAEKRTLSRIAAAVPAGLLDAESAANLDETFRLLWEVRLEHQRRRVGEGVDPDDFVDPAKLGQITRRGLREAFGVISSQQRAVALEFGIR